MNLDTWALFIGTTISTIVTVATGYTMLSRSLRKEFDKRFNGNDKRLDAIDKRFSTLDATLAQMDHKFTEQLIGVNNRIDRVNARIDDALKVNNR